MYNFVQRAFIGKASGAASTAQTVGQPIVMSSVVTGDLYLTDENGLVLDAASAAVATAAKVVRGTTAGRVLSSSLMRKAGFNGSGIKYTFQAYGAPVQQVSNFADLGLVANTQYKLVVVIRQDLALIANRQDRIETYLTTAATGFTIAAEIAKLVANFNKQRGSLGIITATVNGATGITLTGKVIPTAGYDDYENVSFEVNFVTLTNNLGATLGFQTAIQPTSQVMAQAGSGVAVQVRQIERIALGFSGVTDLRNAWYRPTPALGAVDGVGYDIYNVQQMIAHEGALQDTMTSPVSTLVAVATGSAQKLAFGGILDAFISGVAVTPPTGE